MSEIPKKQEQRRLCFAATHAAVMAYSFALNKPMTGEQAQEIVEEVVGMITELFDDDTDPDGGDEIPVSKAA